MRARVRPVVPQHMCRRGSVHTDNNFDAAGDVEAIACMAVAEQQFAAATSVGRRCGHKVLAASPRTRALHRFDAAAGRMANGEGVCIGMSSMVVPAKSCHTCCARAHTRSARA